VGGGRRGAGRERGGRGRGSCAQDLVIAGKASYMLQKKEREERLGKRTRCQSYLVWRGKGERGGRVNAFRSVEKGRRVRLREKETGGK